MADLGDVTHEDLVGRLEREGWNIVSDASTLNLPATLWAATDRALSDRVFVPESPAFGDYKLRLVDAIRKSAYTLGIAEHDLLDDLKTERERRTPQSQCLAETPAPSTGSGVDDLQRSIEQITHRIWPGESMLGAGLALCEEAGEVARAINKRSHQVAGTGDRPETDWTAELRRELAQVVVVAMKIAEREGFSLFDAVVEESGRLQARLAAIEGADRS